MKRSWYKILIIILLMFFSSALILLAQAEVRKAKARNAPPDTSGIIKGKLPDKAEEIEIGEDKISIRTKEGKRVVIGKGESDADISLDENKIKIGETEINLKDLQDSLKIKIPKIEISSPKIHLESSNADIVRFGRDIVVEEDETVDGSAVAIFGNVEVKGTVNQDAVAVWGSVKVASTGVIEGDVVSVGGDVQKDTGATIRGKKTMVSFGPKRLVGFPPFIGGFSGFAFIARIIKIIFFLFLGIVVISIAPRNVSKVKEKISRDFFKCVLAGFIAEILILPVFLLLIITIIGIPVAILVEPLLIVVSFFLGYTGVSYFVGEKLKSRTSLKPETPVMTLILGVLAIEAILLFARIVGILGHFLLPISLVFTLLGWAIWYVAVTVGFGAAVLTRLGTRPKDMIFPSFGPLGANPNSTGESPSKS
jgi:hypothetical protein